MLLLTGITGFLGGATGTHLLTSHPSLRIRALVRAETPEQARSRVLLSIGRFVKEDVARHLCRRVDPVLGSLDDPNLAFPSDVARQVTHVLHLAACTSFHAVRRAREINLKGGLRLAGIASGFSRLERYLHVGTAFACGVNGQRVVPEGAQDAEEHLCEYTRTKSLCESELRQMPIPLPLVVARPSVVVGHTSLGTVPSASIYWYIRALHRLGRSPFPRGGEALRDLVPVDWVAGALDLLLYKPKLGADTYHLSSGEHFSDRWQDIVRGMDRELGPRTDATVEEAFGIEGEAADRVRSAMAAFDRFSGLQTECFANDRILAEGMPPPPRFTSYLARCALHSRLGRSLLEELDGEA